METKQEIADKKERKQWARSFSAFMLDIQTGIS
jgi:hypothetical protein